MCGGPASSNSNLLDFPDSKRMSLRGSIPMFRVCPLPFREAAKQH
ncbi:hypothetical protein M5D96_008623 [Drosophila gunungcola]|uniref:Uncharacterized protein n=1 Tax=Drosophila gunungcola TaxID=103775 RepID=A0A9P9YL61_9MUSC|nr:hypothetical protein M5D96_008623 [Drosophila gunungcola]